MKPFVKTVFLILCLVLLCTYIGNAGFRMVGEIRGLYFSVLWDRWFEVPVWVYVESRQLFFLGGGSVYRATAAFPLDIHGEIVKLFEKGLREVDNVREKGDVPVVELGSVKAVIDSSTDHYNGIDVYLAKDRSGQSSDLHLRI